MKITAIKTYAVKVGIRNQLLVKIETDEGIFGWGESGLSGREKAVVGALEHYAEFLQGRDPFRIGALWQELYRSQYFEGGRVPKLRASISSWTRSSSSTSACVAKPTNQRVSAGSISISISQMSRTNSSSIGRTRAPRFGVMTTKPSPRSCCNASRIGFVDVPSRPASSATFSRSFALTRPEMMSSRNCS